MYELGFCKVLGAGEAMELSPSESEVGLRTLWRFEAGALVGSFG